VFIHGIGIGLLPYIPFLRELADQDPDVGILAIETLPMSMHITEPLLARDAMCDAITRILNAHGLRRIVLAGHSFGTAISAYLLRRQWGSVDRPSIPPTPALPRRPTPGSSNHASNIVGSDDLIAATLLVDPIPFLLHHPAVAYNFLYRPPRHANEWQLWYFASRDADVARALSRHFFWSECVLFREDVLGSSDGASAAAGVKDERRRRGLMPFAVSLAGRDQIVDAPAVHAYLTNGERCTPVVAAAGAGAGAGAPSRWARDSLEVLYYPELDHATVFDTRERRAPIVKVLRRFVRLDESDDEDEGGLAGAGTGLDRLVDVE
jgi:pimeloyl-ACP methyl ester carboxylesterase